MDEAWEQTKSDISHVLNQVSNNKFSQYDIPFFQFGKKNYQASIENIFWKIQMDDNYSQKYLYKQEMTPIEEKAAHLFNLFAKYQQ